MNDMAGIELNSGATPLPLRERYVEAWLALEQNFDDGLSSAIGVSNFETHHLADVLGAAGIVPAVNPDRMRENLGAVDVVLDDEDLTRIGSLDGAGRRGPHPDEFDLL